MTPAVADAAAASPPPPGPGPALGRRDLAAVKALMFPCLASLWVGGASAAAAAVTHAIHSWGECPGMMFALVLASLGTIFFAALLTSYACCSCAPPYAIQIPYCRYCAACGPSLRSLLRDTAWFSCFAALTFDVLSVVGCFVAVELSMGHRVGRIGTLVIDVGAVISAGISCIDILRSTALKLWRMKPSGASADACVV